MSVGGKKRAEHSAESTAMSYRAWELRRVGSMAARKANILVVDDKRANLIALDAVLGAEHNVLFAQSGDEAIALVEKRRDIHLILMDVQMPDMDGFEAAARIKSMEAGRDLPVIFVTAIFTEDPWVKRGYQVGGIDYFAKPFDPEILRLKVAVYASYKLKSDFLRERELHVRESEELLRVGRKLSSVLESLPVGVLIADVDGRICQTTEEVARILNISDAADGGAYGEVLGWWDTAGKALKNHAGPLARALHGETSSSVPLSVRRFNGTDKTILASASPLRGLDGRIVGAVILVQDVTESRQIESDLQRRVTNLISLGVELEESASAS